jgi:hypothetical protein
MATEVRTTPESTVQAIKDLAAAVERHPEEATTLHTAILEQLEHAPRINEPDGYAHIARHLRGLGPILMNHTEIRPVLDRLVDEGDGESPESSDPGLEIIPTVKAAVALAALAYAVIELVEYCIEGPSPPPGQSLPTDC